uniref:NADH-ubiquinone oxidoreductase chain 3 n=1 Tax=Bombus waltoni TaxID=395577 RepID=A0A649WEB1_9HYME|nr:NADH dehydrogenase subunit 3 [Bombus waltoni]QGK86772.1 NADH dehydrogenase subunit 3 [Bombus waltoni]
MYFMLFSLLTMMIIFIIITLNKFFSMIKMKNFEKNLPFECGFNPVTKPNLPFSLPFYMISLMFLIFDVEIILLIPMIMYIKYSNSLIIFNILMFFIISLIFTLMIEWTMEYLNWMY